MRGASARFAEGGFISSPLIASSAPVRRRTSFAPALTVVPPRALAAPVGRTRTRRPAAPRTTDRKGSIGEPRGVEQRPELGHLERGRRRISAATSRFVAVQEDSSRPSGDQRGWIRRRWRPASGRRSLPGTAGRRPRWLPDSSRCTPASARRARPAGCSSVNGSHQGYRRRVAAAPHPDDVASPRSPLSVRSEQPSSIRRPADLLDLRIESGEQMVRRAPSTGRT